MKIFLIILLLKFTLFQIKHGDTFLEIINVATTLEEQVFRHINLDDAFKKAYHDTEKKRIQEITEIKTKQEDDRKKLDEIKTTIREISLRQSGSIVLILGFLILILIRSSPNRVKKAIQKTLLKNGKVI